MAVAVDNKPVCFLFLDVDGVLIEYPYTAEVIEKSNAKTIEMFGEKPKYTTLETRQALSHFFDPIAVAALNTLIEKIQQKVDLRIVISSAWRYSGTIRDLQKKIFQNTGFGHLIVAKTPQSPQYDKQRGFQIQRWIERRTYKNTLALVLDDNRFDLLQRFSLEFVQIHYQQLITAENVNDAFTRVMMQILMQRFPDIKVTITYK